MIIALDWDGTANQDPFAFAAVVSVLRASGHKVFICTMRYPYETLPQHLLASFGAMEIVYTSRKAKKPFCRAHGIAVDVWIDDQPEFLLRDAAGAETSSIQINESNSTGVQK